MDIYEYAMQMERDGENLYREMASTTENAGIRTILTMLADAEVEHYNTFKKLKLLRRVELPDTDILKVVAGIFTKIKESGNFTNLNISQIGLYRKAQEIEKMSEEFYLKESVEVEDDFQRRIFRRIAREEGKHYFILENIIDFVSRPEQWNENAEWYHLEEY